MRFDSTLSPTRWRNKPIYRTGIFREGPTRIHARCSNTWKLWNKSTMVVTLLKIPTRKNPTGPVMAGNIRENNLPCEPTQRRAVLESTRKKCRTSKQSYDQCKKYMLVVCPRALYGRLQITKVILQQVRRAAATPRKRSPLRW